MTKKSPHTRMPLGTRLVLSYAAMTVFTLASLLIAVAGIFSLHTIAVDIARNDLPRITATQKLKESLATQVRLASKFSVLHEPEFKELFSQRQGEFQALLRVVGLGSDVPAVVTATNKYEEFLTVTTPLFEGQQTVVGTIRKAAEAVTDSLDNLALEQQQFLKAKLDAADRKEQLTLKWTLILSFTGFALAVTVAAWFVYTITAALRKLKQATHRIAEGDFDHDPQIPEGDEIGDLARDFTTMAAKLKELEQISLDASPLTRLPGNIAIERSLMARIKSGESFAICYADLDNFKAYNDRYGYVRASELILKTAEIIYQAVHKHSVEDAFVGHVGGDDFVLVIADDKVETVCEAVIAEFDGMIGNFYSAEDISHGAIEGIDRYGVPRTFPIMTISIAVLTCGRGEYSSPVEIAKAVAEIKDYVKETPGSNYMVNRRKKTP